MLSFFPSSSPFWLGSLLFSEHRNDDAGGEGTESKDSRGRAIELEADVVRIAGLRGGSDVLRGPVAMASLSVVGLARNELEL